MSKDHSCQCGGQSVYVPEPATLSRVEPLTEMETFFEVKFDSGRSLGHMPGQFVEVSIPGIGEGPISVSSGPSGNGSFEIVVRRVGRLTTALHGLTAGSPLGIRGPFGTTFPVDADEMKGRDIVFVCGGIGLVPVRSAIQYVLANRADYGAVTILYGTKSPADRLFVPELDEWAARDDVSFAETVDQGGDGWTGNVGVITTLIPDVTMDPATTSVIVCGPPVMYKFVILSLREKQIADENVYVSLERRMKCGVGKCGHCQINGLYTCMDGPVFKYADVSEIEEAI